MATDDHRLVAQAQAGDQQAFEMLVQQYQRRVYGVAFGMLHNAEDAMDVTQEAFIKVHRYLGRFKGTSSFFTWLYRITVNLCIDHLRRQTKAHTVDYDDALDHGDEGDGVLPWSADHDPGRTLERKELRAQIEQALSKLSPNHRAVIVMREVEGLSYTEMADVMECSKGTIMSRLFHARRRMQVALEEAMADKNKSAA